MNTIAKNLFAVCTFIQYNIVESWLLKSLSIKHLYLHIPDIALKHFLCAT